MQIGFAGDLFGRGATSAHCNASWPGSNNEARELHFLAHSMVALIAG
jgi:hypothetical protein